LSPDAGIEGDSEHPTPVVEVLGAAPATPGHEVPGSLVGYMPQYAFHFFFLPFLIYFCIFVVLYWFL
jgi:hypothetical protein